MTEHPQVIVYNSKAEPVEVDMQMAELIRTLWMHGYETLFSCQGEPCEPDENHSLTQAYISFPGDDAHFLLTLRVLHDFPYLFMATHRGEFSVEFDEHDEFGRRIVWRFPQFAIQLLSEWMD